MDDLEPTVCRLYSIPASLVEIWDGQLGLLCSSHVWIAGDDPSAATIAEVNAAYAAVIDAAYAGGCRMIGEILELATDDIPSWALLCDGTEYEDADYPDLGAVISAGLRIDGTHFRTPDRVNRIGMQGPPTGVIGGENTHTLTTAEMPTHNHTDAGHTHIYDGWGVASSVVLGELPGFQAAPTPTATASGSADIQDTGGGNAHNNLQQYEGTIFVIVATNA